MNIQTLMWRGLMRSLASGEDTCFQVSYWYKLSMLLVYIARQLIHIIESHTLAITQANTIQQWQQREITIKVQV